MLWPRLLVRNEDSRSQLALSAAAFAGGVKKTLRSHKYTSTERRPQLARCTVSTSTDPGSE